MGGYQPSIPGVLLSVVIIATSPQDPVIGGVIAVFVPRIMGISIRDEFENLPEFGVLGNLSGFPGVLGGWLMWVAVAIFALFLVLDLYDILTDPYRRLQWLSASTIFLILPVIRGTSVHQSNWWRRSV